MHPDRVWTTSIFARIYGTTAGLVLAIMPSVTTPRNGTRPWHGEAIFWDGLGVFFGLAIVCAMWRARLVLADGILTARNFFRSVSIPLQDVVAVTPVPLAMWIRPGKGIGILTMVASQPVRPYRLSRADRIGNELVALARIARAGGEIPPQFSKPTGYPSGLHRKV